MHSNTLTDSIKENEKAQEEKHWRKVMRTMCVYDEMMTLELQRRQKHINLLSKEHTKKLPAITFDKFAEFSHAMDNNAFFLREIVRFYSFTNYSEDFLVENGFIDYMPPDCVDDRIFYSDQKRNEAILHSAYREWSVEGGVEREKTFSPIILALQEFLPVDSKNAYQQRVLVPGCGLGRLPLEIASNGYRCEGNEFSAFMVIGSHFLLNGTDDKRQFIISPWLDRTSNVRSVGDTTRQYLIPDKIPMSILEADDHLSSSFKDVPKLSFSAGDFMTIYGKPSEKDSWDCIVTCFFIDTAPVVMEYFDVIHHLLRPGGLWINLGPLLYHWTSDDDNTGDNRYSRSIELSWEEIKCIIKNYKFEILKELDIDTAYCAMQESMLQSSYLTKIFVAKKTNET